MGKLYTLDWIDYDKLGAGAVGVGWKTSPFPGCSSAPANDNFANAIDLPGPTGTQTGTDNLRRHLGVWRTRHCDLSWRRDQHVHQHGLVQMDLPGKRRSHRQHLGLNGHDPPTPGEYDAVLGIYSGSAVNALTPLGTTPQDTGFQETMTVAVTAGTTYHIQVAGWNRPWQPTFFSIGLWSRRFARRSRPSGPTSPGAVPPSPPRVLPPAPWTGPCRLDLGALAPTFTLSPGANLQSTNAAIPPPPRTLAPAPGALHRYLLGWPSQGLYRDGHRGPALSGRCDRPRLWLDASAPDTMTLSRHHRQRVARQVGQRGQDDPR